MEAAIAVAISASSSEVNDALAIIGGVGGQHGGVIPAIDDSSEG